MTAALSERPKLSRRFRLQYEEAQSRWVLLYPEGMVQLNHSAAEILQRCDGERSLPEIVAELEQAFNAQDLAPQVQSLLEEGQRRGWID
ncbi:MAG TPA: pyrroloquinoline quinone biosynthesis peptide chaperone PqqD [Hydrogenophaga sp.]|jgi:pyrroloquinoline quinone biosynthesis protein D|uniref:pyrroloquinoline quinone biosynthesis peptide chaperone PqqD n=1 Tax=Hydrogenophaga sp. TaxID=1904254 RepID=UPI0008AAC6B8|nr:pyrroloquinoline quinone biosynthesis peptide chaperone PqqD [Hydrogenophaga sp.]MBU4183395.1 pyrroloquinoline quinone biosynthesis peptide chaperone PqqD [Gammaproteobacteria bacterium]OGA76647.1 MAG: pyrroloquinoline quinone biosynthesis protein PqqD [Burkholderiales bacterium GWE1_65_30]OGA91563.1 MAG: pyrroloquinoline quinone biosynthesis protein PqqD [Burkholderiales bacterium GWF1_66_17]PKO74554.1 MAG: pyrroloquinoline quinone biosynthesis peptide chaperone PqqD [Betaproteobacteria bac